MSAEHVPRPIHKIMRLIHQQNIVPLFLLKEPLQGRRGIEGVVIVTDDHIRPERQVQGKLKGADLIRLAPSQNGFLGKAIFRLQSRVQGLIDPVKMPLCARADIWMAKALLHRAELVLGRQGDGLHLQSLRPQNLQRIAGRLSRDILRGQIKNPLHLSPLKCLNRGEQSAHGFPDSSGGLQK